MYEDDIARWTAAALAIPAKEVNGNPGTPRNVFLQEVLHLADQSSLIWSPSNPNLPALSKNRKRLPDALVEDFRSMRRAVQGQDTLWMRMVAPKRPIGKTEEARDIHDEILVALEYALDDDIFELADEQLAKYKSLLQQEEDNVANLPDRLTKVLSLAREHKDKLQAIADDGDFDMSLLDKAAALLAELEALPATPQLTTPESQAALDLRNRFIHLLIELVGKLREVVRFKYRAHPNIEEKFSSPYERRRNARRERNKLAEDKKLQEEQNKRELQAKKARIREALQEEELVAEVKREMEAEKQR